MFTQSAFWLDGTPTSVLPLPDRGLDYGDGLFETLLIRHGKPLFRDLHLERLAQGLQALALPNCLADVREQIDHATRSAERELWPWAVLRLSVVRGSGLRGYAPPINVRPRIIICISRIDRDCGQLAAPATLGIAAMRLPSQPCLAQIKHLNRLEQVLAAAQAQAEDRDECIVLDQTDQLTSVIAGNIFLVRHGELLTPRIVECGVLGTRRRLIIEKWAPSIGLHVHEIGLRLEDVQDAEEIFYSNSLVAMRPVGRLNEQRWDNHFVCQALFQQYLQELSCYSG